ncbi:sorting nexin 6 [Trichuris trichiura]|uniref:Sorting nexin 6 n=1 Tax=Trichuris trichiura TaxID=36087 RepID=A0A077YXI6_TRITR|nr:sorting nexin 6 [Trichuris trichiura]
MTNLPDFTQHEVSVIREHEEFIWLYDAFDENPVYAGYIIPPPPPRPDFDTSREKLQKLSEGETTMTRDEFAKMKAELEAEYLATFKKTVAMHELFLARLACHPVFRSDSNFRIFLEYQDSLSIRGKNKKEMLESIWKRFSQSADEVLLSGQKDRDPFFEHEKNYLVEYYGHLREAVGKSDKMTKALKSKLPSNLLKISDTYEKIRKLESRVASDYDLKLSDTFRYTVRDTQAAKDLLYRRLRCLANLETAGRNLERARMKNREIPKVMFQPSPKFQKKRKKLQEFKGRRVATFKRNLIDLAELQLKHAKVVLNRLSNIQHIISCVK